MENAYILVSFVQLYLKKRMHLNSNNFNQAKK